MKALFLAATFAVLSSTAVAGARHDAHQPPLADSSAPVLVADAGRIGSTGLTSLNPGGTWSPSRTDAGAADEVASLPVRLDGGALWVLVGAGVWALARPVRRALRRQEEQRRATALASTLGQSHRG